MSNQREIQSFNTVMMNLNEAIDRIAGASLKGLIKGAVIIRADMDRTPPMIPVDTNNLRSSWFTSTAYSNDKPTVYLGFTANYAVYVHEMINANFQRPDSGAKFFEASLKRNGEKILQIIREEAHL